jgi:hypothetical protein
VAGGPVVTVAASTILFIFLKEEETGIAAADGTAASTPATPAQFSNHQSHNF